MNNKGLQKPLILKKILTYLPYNHARPKLGLIHWDRESSVIRLLLYLQATTAGSRNIIYITYLITSLKFNKNLFEHDQISCRKFLCNATNNKFKFVVCLSGGDFSTIKFERDGCAYFRKFIFINWKSFSGVLKRT